jgi:hypothetical protein
LDDAPTEDERANLALAVAVTARATGSDEPQKRFEGFLSDVSQPRLRVCAALGLQTLQRDAASPSVAEALLSANDPKTGGDWLVWNEGELMGLVVKAWTQLPATYTEAILKTAAGPFLDYDSKEATAIGILLLRRFFPNPVPRKTPFARFDEHRKILLLILAQHEHGWDDPLPEVLAHLSLPKSPVGLGWYIQGLDPETGEPL